MLEYIEHHAIDTVVPTRVLTIGPKGVSDRWFRGFAKEVTNHAQRMGLCVDRWTWRNRALAWLLVAVALVPAWIVADNSGGMLLTQTVAGDRQAMISSQGKRAHVLIKENDQDRIDLGRQNNGRYSLLVSGAQNKVVAGIGQSKAGSGLVLVADAAGAERAKMWVDSPAGGGRVDVANSSSAIVGVISAGAQAGHLQLTDSGGKPMVEAGVIDSGAGVVRAGPLMRDSGVGLVGLVPSYILGKP